MHGKKILDEKQRKKIRKLRKEENLSTKSLSIRFGVSSDMIYDILKEKENNDR
jgi:hypothetical protein